MIEFINNNALFLIIFMILFFMNKNFHSRISFDFNFIEYESIRERLQVARVKDIFDYMNKTLIFARRALIKSRKQMMKQANKHKKKVNYELGLKIFLNEKNIITIRSFKKLNDKMLEPFINLSPVGSSYKLKLSDSMRVSLIHHLFPCFDQSFTSEDQCLVHLFRYILDSIDLQAFASAFILDDVRVEAHMKMKVLVHEEEDQEDD